MKKQAADALKAEKAEARKTEAARKKEAKTVTRKSMSLASKMTTPLGKAWQSGQDVVAKAQQAGVTDLPEVKQLQEMVKTTGEWQKATASAIAFFTKNPGGEIKAMPFADAKEATEHIKDVNNKCKDVKKLIADAKKAAKSGATE